MIRFIALFALHLMASPLIAQISVSSPRFDDIIPADTVTLLGQAPPNAIVSVDDGAQLQLTTASSSGTWELAGISLDPGVNTLTVSIDGAVHSIVLTRASISARPPQKIRIQWKGAAEADLRRIATRTLTPVPATPQQDDFVRAVKNRTEQLTIGALRAAANVVLVSMADTNTHTVVMTQRTDVNYGQFNPGVDCLNVVPNDGSMVSVGYLANRMINDFNAWRPLTTSDSVADRVEDVSQALARTAVHEIAHSLGLVGRTGACDWMDGSDAAHPIAGLPPGVIREGRGRFVMDEAPEPHRRMGFVSQTRTTVRLPIVFCDFNRFYLELLLP